MNRSRILARIRKLEAAGAGHCQCGFVVVGDSREGHCYEYERGEDVPQPCPECGRERIILRIVYEERAETNPLGEQVEPTPTPEPVKPRTTRPPLPEFSEGRERREEADDDSYGAALIETVMRR